MNEAESTPPNHKASACSGAVSVPRSSPSWPFTVGIPLLLIGLFFQTVSLVGGSYAAVLIIALVLTALADACFVGCAVDWM